MIENLLEQGDQREIYLYWGTRNRAELYLDELPSQWAREHGHIHYQRAILEPAGSSDSQAFHGFVHQAVLADFPDLSGHDVYMSGPPAMIDTAKLAFQSAGVVDRRLYYDSFEFGLDVPVRVLARPH